MGKREGLFFGPLERNGTRISGSPAGILIEALDYHVEALGLRMRRTPLRSSRPKRLRGRGVSTEGKAPAATGRSL